MDQEDCRGSRAVTFFGCETVNRVSFLRSDPQFMKAAFENAATIFVPYVEGNGLMRSRDMDLLTMTRDDEEWNSNILSKVGPLLDTAEGWVCDSGFLVTFLGLMPGQEEAVFKYKEYEGTPVFGIDLRPSNTTTITLDDVVFLKEGYQAIDRTQMFNLSNESASLVSHGMMYFDWLSKYHYCPGCGKKIYPVQGGSKLQCSNSDLTAKCHVRDARVTNVCFPRTDPVIIVAIVDKSFSKICLARSRRKYSDHVMYSTIAGFMEPAETVEHACQREIWEETGIKVDLDNIDILFTQPWPYPSNLMIGCLGLIEFNGNNEKINLEHDQELLDAKWFDMKDIAEAFDKHDPDSTKLVEFDDVLRFPGRTAIAHQLIQHAVTKFKRFNANL